MKDSVWEEKCLFSPSLISVCDLCNLEASVKELEKADVQMLHVDILDGHFSPSMPLGLDTVRQLRKKTDLPFDVHVMASSNDFFIEELLDIGVEQIVFHGECETHVDGRLNMIHQAGCRAGVALKPGTSLHMLDYVLEKCDAVLLMLINPGYAQVKNEGQVCYARRKIIELSEMIRSRNLNTKVILDGRISKQDIADYACNGLADIFVTGSTCINKNNLFDSMQELNALRRNLLEN